MIERHEDSCITPWRCRRCNTGFQSTRAPELCFDCDRAHVVAILLVRGKLVGDYATALNVFDAVIKGVSDYEAEHGDDIPY